MAYSNYYMRDPKTGELRIGKGRSRPPGAFNARREFVPHDGWQKLDDLADAKSQMQMTSEEQAKIDAMLVKRVDDPRLPQGRQAIDAERQRAESEVKPQ